MSQSIHDFPSEVIEEECTKGGVVGTYLLNDVDGGTMSRECPTTVGGKVDWTYRGEEGGCEGEDITEKVGQRIMTSSTRWTCWYKAVVMVTEVELGGYSSYFQLNICI